MKTFSLSAPPLRPPGLLLFPLLLSLTFCGAGRAQVRLTPPPVVSSEASPTSLPDRIYAQIWVDFAPEYRALCLQTFHSALRAIREVAEAAPRLNGRPVDADGKPLAVIADLDETILDNSGYQARLVVEGKDYSPESWQAWVERIDGVYLLPGAGEFVRQVEALGVSLIYLSNRRDETRRATLETLRRLGVDTRGLDDPSSRRLLLRTDVSDKTPRRQLAASSYGIVAYLGDNLGDFPGMLPPEVSERMKGVEGAAEMWGTRWFVLPNPTYGSWTDVFRGQDPLELLRKLTREEDPN